MKLRVGKRAQKQAANIEQWWVEHRAASPDLFAGELEQTFHHICSVRVAGVGWPTPRRPTLRRILMPRSQRPRVLRDPRTDADGARAGHLGSPSGHHAEAVDFGLDPEARTGCSCRAATPVTSGQPRARACGHALVRRRSRGTAKLAWPPRAPRRFALRAAGETLQRR